MLLKESIGYVMLNEDDVKDMDIFWRYDKDTNDVGISIFSPYRKMSRFFYIMESLMTKNITVVDTSMLTLTKDDTVRYSGPFQVKRFEMIDKSLFIYFDEEKDEIFAQVKDDIISHFYNER